MKGTRQYCQVAFNTRAMAAFSPSWASEITSWTPRRPRRASVRRNSVQNVSASEQPTAMPRTSRRPASVAPVAMLAPAGAGGDSDRDDASALPHLYISGVEPDIRPTAFQRTVQESLDLFIDLAHSRDTWLLEMPLIPMAWTSSSTERVETP